MRGLAPSFQLVLGRRWRFTVRLPRVPILRQLRPSTGRGAARWGRAVRPQHENAGSRTAARWRNGRLRPDEPHPRRARARGFGQRATGVPGSVERRDASLPTRSGTPCATDAARFRYRSFGPDVASTAASRAVGASASSARECASEAAAGRRDANERTHPRGRTPTRLQAPKVERPRDAKSRKWSRRRPTPGNRSRHPARSPDQVGSLRCRGRRHGSLATCLQIATGSSVSTDPSGSELPREEALVGSTDVREGQTERCPRKVADHRGCALNGIPVRRDAGSGPPLGGDPRRRPPQVPRHLPGLAQRGGMCTVTARRGNPHGAKPKGASSGPPAATPVGCNGFSGGPRP